MAKKKEPGDKASKSAKGDRYNRIIEKIFYDHYKPGVQRFAFEREEIITSAQELGIDIAKNTGDVVYSYRFRKPLPPRVAETAKDGYEWSIALRGKSTYEFVHDKITPLEPNPAMAYIKIPNATPEIITRYALTDEQSLLAKVRYNRLIDLFLGITAYSLQNHLRTSITLEGGKHQIETDEVYVGINRTGCQFVVPVQAKGGKDKLGATQAKQDLLLCEEKFSNLVCRPVSAQFLPDDVIALFELALQDGRIAIVREAHYKLVPSSDISKEELESYKLRATSEDA